MTGRGPAVVVGGSLAGAKAALALRQSGWQEPIVLVGDEPCLPYERPQLSKSYLADQRHLSNLLVAPAERYAEAGIDLVLGHRVTDLSVDDRAVRLDDGRRLTYGVLVLATGARAAWPSVLAGGLRGVHVLRTLADADRLRADVNRGTRVAVVGLGLIGSEVAATLTGLGARVVAIDPLPLPLARAVPPVVGDLVRQLHVRAGVELFLGHGLARLHGTERVEAVELTDGTRLPVDVVVAGLGAVPNVELAERAGLDVARGVLTDELGRTSAPDVYAVGDVTEQLVPHRGRHERVEHWKHAIVQAECVAATITGTPSPVDVAPWFWTEQHGVHLEAVGWTGVEPDAVLVDGVVGLDGAGQDRAPATGFLVSSLVGDQVQAVTGVGRGRELRALGRRLPAGLHLNQLSA